MNKIAIVHEWFVTFAGAEKVIEQLLHVFPGADLFALIDFMPPEVRGFLQNKPVRTSFLQHFPLINAKNYRQYLPWMPIAIEQLDLSGYDVVISNCHAVSKGVITGPEQLHIGYIHSPMRYAWEMQNTYLRASGFGGLKTVMARLVLHYMRNWDVNSASRPDKLYANSRYIQQRVQKTYRRDAEVLYPPVDIEFFTPGQSREDFYLVASRLVPYKRVDLVLEAFRHMPDRKLVIIGAGPDAPSLKKIKAPNITWLDFQPHPVLRDHMQRCKAFLFAGKEDFGIMPLEAQACGTPVIAFGEGGLAETIIGLETEKPTGVFFPEQTVDSLQEAVDLFEKNAARITPKNCRCNAERFSSARFRREVCSLVQSAWEEFKQNR